MSLNIGISPPCTADFIFTLNDELFSIKFEEIISDQVRNCCLSLKKVVTNV